MFLTDLFESSRVSAMETLERYLNRPNMFVSFVDIEKLGINPKSDFESTPIGIYAYPIQFAYGMMEQRMGFAGDRKYVCLFEGVGNLLDLQTYTVEDYDRDVDGLADQWQLIDPKNQDFAMHVLVRWQEEMLDLHQTAGKAFFKLVDRIAARAERIHGREQMIISNTMFRRLGYDGLVDNGGGIIHVHEPTQALFLSKAACRVVDFVVNDHIPDHRPAFPARGEKKPLARGEKYDPANITV